MKHSFLLLFFTGVIPLVLSVSRKYYLIQQGKFWSDARDYCQAEYTDLAIIEDIDDMVQLQNEIQKNLFSSSAWIGLYDDINSWRWSLGNEPLGNVQLWVLGEPNNRFGSQWCGAISTYGWYDLQCTKTFPFICFDGTKNGIESYIYISNMKTWFDAQTYCRKFYTDLASARSTTENSLIAQVTPVQSWFGLFRDNWKWVNQTKFSTISWMSGEPDNALSNENCGYLYNLQAADAQCSDIMPFFCYGVITGKQQIVRVKVRSNQDVNDPAVKVAILEQIKQELKDHGIAENITVKWREQPDRNVFHKRKEN